MSLALHSMQSKNGNFGGCVDRQVAVGTGREPTVRWSRSDPWCQIQSRKTQSVDLV